MAMAWGGAAWESRRNVAQERARRQTGRPAANISRLPPGAAIAYDLGMFARHLILALVAALSFAFAGPADAIGKKKGKGRSKKPLKQEPVELKKITALGSGYIKVGSDRIFYDTDTIIVVNGEEAHSGKLKKGMKVIYSIRTVDDGERMAGRISARSDGKN